MFDYLKRPGDRFVLSCWNFCQENGQKPRGRLVRAYAWCKTRQFVYELLYAATVYMVVGNECGKRRKLRTAIKVAKSRGEFLWTPPNLPKVAAFP